MSFRKYLKESGYHLYKIKVGFRAPLDKVAIGEALDRCPSVVSWRAVPKTNDQIEMMTKVDVTEVDNLVDLVDQTLELLREDDIECQVLKVYK